MSQIDRIRDAHQPQIFPEPQQVISRETACDIVAQALAKWEASTPEAARRIASILEDEFPDQAEPGDFWHSQSSIAFRDFFVWGHDHNFGCGVSRVGAMGSRHVEIITEAIRLGMLPTSLQGKQVLDVGCWSGGDLLVLAGLGGQVIGMEEHPIAAKAAQRLIDLLGLKMSVIESSLFADKQEWSGQFDYAYCSGVIYHVTDPMLLLRILFTYLKPGGDVFIETKSATGEGSLCSYSGTLEKGWNWYAPNETALGRWMVDAGFDVKTVRVYRRDNGRLLACGRKTEARALRETSGFSRPGSWLEEMV